MKVLHGRAVQSVVGHIEYGKSASSAETGRKLPSFIIDILDVSKILT